MNCTACCTICFATVLLQYVPSGWCFAGPSEHPPCRRQQVGCPSAFWRLGFLSSVEDHSHQSKVDANVLDGSILILCRQLPEIVLICHLHDFQFMIWQTVVMAQSLNLELASMMAPWTSRSLLSYTWLHRDPWDQRGGPLFTH